MKKKKIQILIIIFVFTASVFSFQFLNSNSHERYNNFDNSSRPKSSAISSSMATNKENYSIFDDVTVFLSFQYGIILDTGTYFTFAFKKMRNKCRVNDNYAVNKFQSQYK